MRHEQTRQVELARFDHRFDIFDVMEVGLFRFRIIGVASHRDITARGFFVEDGIEFAPIHEPILEVGRRRALRRASIQLIE